MSSSIRQQIIQLIKQSQRILIMPSMPVDGDCLGSSLALYLTLKKLNKEVTVVCADPIPEALKFLPTTKVISQEFSGSNDYIVTIDCKKAKVNTIRTQLEQDKVNIIFTAKEGQFSAEDISFSHGASKYDLIITVDTGDLEQLGRFYEDNPKLFVTIPVINIDHHASNSHFGKINYVDVMSSATTELLIPLIEECEQEFNTKLMDEDIATLLLAGIITDTGSFQNANTNPRSFAASAQLIRYGARQQEIIRNVYKTKQLSMLKLWGRILSNLKVDTIHKIGWATISQKDFKDTGSREEETGDIIDELLTNAPEIEIVILIKEKKRDIISGSIRTTTPSADASVLAGMFGGGGHVQAAGFKVQGGSLEKVEQEVLAKFREYQKQRLGLHEEDAHPEEVPFSSMGQPLEIEAHTKVDALPTASHEESTPMLTDNTNSSFTDTIVKKVRDKNQELEPGVTYKFED